MSESIDGQARGTCGRACATRGAAADREPPLEDHTGLELVEIPAGACTVGAPGDAYAYDNERPRHRVQLPAFKIDRTPVTNGAYLEFVRAGGIRLARDL